MSISPDTELKSRSKVLSFPVSRSAARRVGPSLRRYWPIGAALAFILALGGAALLAVFGTKSPARYTTTQVTRGTIARTATATGTVNPVLTIIVGTYVSGVIQNIYCDYNTQVRAGQVCARIDPRPYQATFDQYSAQLARDQAVLDKDRKDLARYQKLASENSIAGQQAEDQAYLVSQDEGTVKLDQALVESAKLNLDYTNIVSPVDGTVVSRNVTGGQTVAASFQTPTLFLIATDLKQMEVDTNTSEDDIGSVKVGDKASFTVDAFAQRTFTGTVGQLRQSPQTVQNVVTYDVVIGVDNGDLSLLPGMTASTQIIIEQKNDVLRVPDQALRYTPSAAANAPATGTAPAGHERVCVLRNGEPVAVAITTGIDDGNFVEIAQGDLHAGDLVITAENGAANSGKTALPAPRL
jgi:HlyD family secretion protein